MFEFVNKKWQILLHFATKKRNTMVHDCPSCCLHVGDYTITVLTLFSFMLISIIVLLLYSGDHFGPINSYWIASVNVVVICAAVHTLLCHG